MGKTVYFRAFEPDDSNLIYEWTNDDSLKKLSVGLNKRVCKEEALEWVKNRMSQQNYQIWWAICARDTDKMIGYTYLCDIHFINRSANLGGMIIADADYRDGTAWIETYIFVMEYAFERLNLNRLYGSYLSEHPMTGIMSDCTFFKTEGVLREAIFKNGEYHDEIINSLLSSEYFLHKQNGDYEINSIMKRLIQMIRTKK